MKPWMEYSLKLLRNPESYLIKAGISNKLENHPEARRCITAAESLSEFEIKKRKYKELLDIYDD